MAQRLVRKLCPHCKQPYELTDDEIKELGLDPKTLPHRRAFRAGTSCTVCQNTGYSGRSGIHELLVIDEEVRSKILQRLDSGSIKSAAQKQGFETLRVDGARKVLEGITSVEEILLATHEEV